MLKKAHIIDVDRIKMNSFYGNVKGVGIPTNIDRNIVIPQPTHVPITTPENELDTTRMKAS